MAANLQWKFDGLCLQTILILLAAIFLSSPAFAESTPTASRPPNVVVILADDSGWGDLSVHGNTNLSTPKLDSLAKEGAAFERFFVCSVCAPTRAEFLTGRYHPRCGVRGVSTGQERLNLDEQTIAQRFQAAGYATGAFGKWHNGSQWPYHPLARGFDEYLGFTSGHWGEYFDPPLEHNGQQIRGDGFIADIFTTQAVKFIEEHQQKPFFCYLAFNTPHSPWAVPEKHWEKFRDKEIKLRGRDGANEDLSTTRCALAMMENLDENVGRVLARLEELKLAEDTIVVYFSDNGPNTNRWNGDMKGKKGTTDEGGLRSPLFIRWPGKIAAGLQIRDIAGAIDLNPTLTALAGVTTPTKQPIDGVDLSPLLLAKSQAMPERMIFSHQNGQDSVRTQTHRLSNKGELFDMRADPGQRQDISAKNQELTAKLQAAVAAWKNDVLPKGKEDRPYPVGYAAFPITTLPARDGVPHGSVKRSAPAPNCSYFVNWKTTDDSITWDIEVQTAGNYQVTAWYTCPPADAGSLVELTFLKSSLRAEVTPGWDPPLYTNQDTIPRPKAESTMKEFRALPLGKVPLEAGRGELKLQAIKIPGGSVMDLRLLTLELLDRS